MSDVRRTLPLWLSVAALGLGACDASERPPPEPEVRVAFDEAERLQLARLRLKSELPPSRGNRFAEDPRAVALGRLLFFDTALSANGAVSCATCHSPERGWADGQVLAQGLGTTGRHAPAIPGNQGGEFFFWDGRADSMWAQALGPIESPVEMGGDRVAVVRYVVANYPEFTEIFGPVSTEGWPEHARPAPEDAGGAHHVAWVSLSEDRRAEVDAAFAGVGKMLEAYERTLLPRQSAFDRYVDAVLGGDTSGGGHLEPAAERGLHLFVGRANCVACHSGPMFTDRAFHNLGLPELAGYDPGRTGGAMLVLSSPFRCGGAYSDTTDCPELVYLNPTFPDFIAAFKTPSLRGVTRTAPYMHHGGLADLDAVLEFYSTLPGSPAAGHRELTLAPLSLTPDERADVKAFLRSLEGEAVTP